MELAMIELLLLVTTDLYWDCVYNHLWDDCICQNDI